MGGVEMEISTPPRFFVRCFTFCIYAQYDTYIIIRTLIFGIAAVATLPRNDNCVMLRVREI